MAAGEEYLRELEQYSSSFDIIKTIGKLSRNKEYLKLRLDQQKKDLSILHTNIEKCRAYNVISFFSYLIGDEVNALRANEKSLHLDPDNIIALSNKARFLLQQQLFAETKQLCDKLKDVYEHPYKKIIAKAEIAFSYTVFGPTFCTNARHLFQEVLTECNELKDDILKSSIEFKENLCTWYFGCTLSYKRLFNIGTIHVISDLDISKESYIAACELCRKIITFKGTSDVCNLYASRAYTILGEIADDLEEKSASLFPNKMKDALPNRNSRHLHLKVDDYFDKALLDGKDCVFVLERSAKHFRHRRNLPKAIQILEKALTIKPTSQSHHHLALAFKNQLEHPSQATRSQGVSPKNYTRPHSSRAYHDDVMKGVEQKFAEMSTSSRGSESHSGQGHRQRMPAYHASQQRSFDHDNYLDSKSNGKYEYRKGGRFSLPNNVGSSLSSSQQSTFTGNSSNHHHGRGRHNRGSSWQHNRGYSDPSGNLDREQVSLKRYINCPRKCWNINIKGSENVAEKIIFHFDEACRINMNQVALYQKGLFCRQIGKFQEALEIFRHVVQNKGEQCGELTLANAYEQAGLCLNDLLKRSLSTNPDNDEENMKQYFKHSIEISCHLVAKVPLLKDCWTSLPTLLSFLDGKFKTKQDLKDLKFLYAKIKDYGKVLHVLNELYKVANDDNEKMEIIVDIIKAHFDNGQYDDAVLAFDVLKCLPNWLDRFDKILYVNVYIEGAFEAFQKNHTQVARLRFQNALDFNMTLANSDDRQGNEERLGDSDDLEELQYDLFVLSNPDNESNGRKLCDSLQRLGLRVTNSVDTPPNHLTMECVIGDMELSRHYIVVYDLDSSDKSGLRQIKFYLSAMKGIIEERNHGNVIILMPPGHSETPGHSEMPKTFKCWKNEEFNFENENLNTLKPLLTYLATHLD